jgi:hypothetical protein
LRCGNRHKKPLICAEFQLCLRELFDGHTSNAGASPITLLLYRSEPAVAFLAAAKQMLEEVADGMEEV